MTKYSFITALLISVSLMLASCSGNKKADTGSRPPEVLPVDVVELRSDQARLCNIETGAIEMRSLAGTLKVNGIITVAPQNYATVCMPMGGFVKSTALMPGNVVAKGQPLAVLENPEFIDMQQNYLEAKNKLEFAEADFKRHSELYKNDVYSQQNLQQVTADYKNLQALVKALEQKLALIGIDPATIREENITRSVTLLSPISGYVKAVNVNVGKFVSPSDVLFEIVNSDKLFLELTLFEKDADKVSAGQQIRFLINNETDVHNAVISQTGKSINADKTCKVYASVSSSCKNMFPGMYVNATIETSGSKVASLPSGAVVSFDDKDYIFVVGRNKMENGKPVTEYKMVQVQKGISDGGFTEVILPPGFDLKTPGIVLKGAYNLLSAKKNAGEMAC